MLFLLYLGILGLSLPGSIVFFVLFAISRRKLCLVVALLFLLPVPYEVLVQMNCTGECNIRVDLLLILPLELLGLGSLSRKALLSFSGYRRSKNEGHAEA